MWPVSVSVGETRYPPGGTFGPRTQFSHQLVLILEGSMRVRIDGELLYASSGTTTLLVPGHHEYFEFDRVAATRHGWLHIVFEGLPEGVADRVRRAPRIIATSSAALSHYERLLGLQAITLPTAREVMFAAALEVFWRHLGEAERQGSIDIRGDDGRADLERALTAVASSMHEFLSLSRLARETSMSGSQLIRLFRRHLDTTPMAYVWEQRVARAIDLVRETGLSLREVADQCGFRSEFHLSRKITARTGRSPTLLRAEARGRTARGRPTE